MFLGYLFSLIMPLNTLLVVFKIGPMPMDDNRKIKYAFIVFPLIFLWMFASNLLTYLFNLKDDQIKIFTAAETNWWSAGVSCLFLLVLFLRYSFLGEIFGTKFDGMSKTHTIWESLSLRKKLRWVLIVFLDFSIILIIVFKIRDSYPFLANALVALACVAFTVLVAWLNRPRRENP